MKPEVGQRYCTQPRDSIRVLVGTLLLLHAISEVVVVVMMMLILASSRLTLGIETSVRHELLHGAFLLCLVCGCRTEARCVM